jgi:hypothetical protein
MNSLSRTRGGRQTWSIKAILPKNRVIHADAGSTISCIEHEELGVFVGLPCLTEP